MSFPKTFPKIEITLVCLNNSVAIKKGSKLGSTEFAHNAIPDFAACKLELENVNKQSINRTNKTGKNKFFNEITKNFFT